jgi:hypothetical protein
MAVPMRLSVVESYGLPHAAFAGELAQLRRGQDSFHRGLRRWKRSAAPIIPSSELGSVVAGEEAEFSSTAKSGALVRNQTRLHRRSQ